MAIISICRGSRSGGEALANCLAAHLGYPVLGREVVQHAATEQSLAPGPIRDALERPPGLLERDRAARNAYIVAVQAALAEAAQTGNLVYHGLAGQLLLRGLPAVCRVRLIAPFEARVQTVMEKERVDRSTAEEMIRDLDAARARWVKLLYGERIDDPALYDMVVNLETMDVETACALITAVVRQPEFAVTERVRTALREFLLACRVKVALLRDAETQGLPLEVLAEDGRIEISGSAPMLSGGEKGDRIAAIARGVPGVEEVRLKFQWFDPYP